MSEKTDELAGQLSQKGSTLAVWRSFLEHPGWKLYKKLLDESADNRKGDILLQPLRSTEQVYAQEFQKGEISAFTLAGVLPFAVLEGLEAEVKVARAKLENEREAENRISPDERSRVDDQHFWGGDDQQQQPGSGGGASSG